MAWTRTFTQMKKDLGFWLGVDTSLTSQNYTRLPDDVRGQLINQARREIALRRDFLLLEETQQFNTADGDNDYDLPADWMRSYSAYYIDDDEYIPLGFITRDEYNELYAEETSSDYDGPEDILIWGDQMYLGPTPDGVYTIYHHYFKLPPDLDGTNDDDFLTHAWDAIFFQACVNGCIFLMEFAQMAVYEKKAREALSYLSLYEAKSRWSARRPISKITSG